MDTKAAQRQLIGLITQHLSESIPVTRILKYQPNKNGSVEGRFESLGRVFNFTFNGNDVKYKPSGNMDSSLFSEYYLERFDATPKAPKGTRALPKCTSKSYSCKGTVGIRCLPLTQHCKLGTDAIGAERLGKIRGLSKMLAGSSEDNSKLESSRAKIVEGRLALAVENKVKREPKSLTKAVVEPVKTVKPKATKTKKVNTEKVIKQEDLSAVKSQKSTIQVREDALKDNKDALVKQFGEKLVNKVESNIQEIINKNDVMIRVPLKHIDSILSEGKMLNSAEVTERKFPQNKKKKNTEEDPDEYEALDYQNTRNQFEEMVMGLSRDTPPSKRPIYGYVGNTTNIYALHQKNVDKYGDVALKLKPQVKDVSSINTYDSFDGRPSSKSTEFNVGSFATVETFKNGAKLGGGDSTSASKTKMFEKVLNGASESKSIDDVVQKTSSPYLEYQIQGGVKTSDIAEIHYTNGKTPSANTVKWAKENGVKIFNHARP